MENHQYAVQVHRVLSSSCLLSERSPLNTYCRKVHECLSPHQIGVDPLTVSLFVETFLCEFLWFSFFGPCNGGFVEIIRF